MEMYRRTFAEIDLDALAHNFGLLHSHFGEDTFLCPMVKANAYGHGDIGIARCLETIGAKRLGVCLIEEGLLLRNFGIKAEILVFRGFDRAGAEKIIHYNMTPVVSTWEHIEHLEQAARGPVNVHVKFDTGMNRLGFRVDEADKVSARLRACKNLQVKGVLTHMAHGEDANKEDGDSAEQIRQFETALRPFEDLNPEVHALNSAAIVNKMALSSPAAHFLGRRNWGLRPGLMIYGVNPVPSQKMDLKPVMSLKAQASVYRTLRTGEKVSYSGTWTATRESTIAVVPIGYADGYHRLLSNRAHVLFAGERVPVVGNVCMDYLMLDVTNAIQKKSPERDAEVVLFGRAANGAEIGVAELAGHAQTIPWEICTSVGERVPRVYKGDRARLLHEEMESK